jgi:hypothetical protein
MKTIVLFCLFTFAASGVHACQPVFSRHTRYFRKAEAVFVGKVVEVGQNDKKDWDPREFPYKIKFAVEKSWKGGKPEITVLSDMGANMCSQGEFRIGDKYLIYAFKQGPELIVYTYVGNRSRPLSYGYEREGEKKEFAELDSFWFRLKARLWIF